MLPLPSQRHLFDIPDDVAFLNCAYMSPLTRASVMACERGLRRKLHPWNIAPADFFTASEAVRGLFAQPEHYLESRRTLALTFLR